MVKILQTDNTWQQMMEELRGDDDVSNSSEMSDQKEVVDDSDDSAEDLKQESEDDSDEDMAPSLLEVKRRQDEVKLDIAEAKRHKDELKRSKVRRSRSRKKKDEVKVADANPKDDEIDALDAKDDVVEIISDDEEELRVIDRALVKLVQNGIRCSDVVDVLARKNFRDYGAYSVRVPQDGGKLATMVALVAANRKVASINGSGTQMIDFLRACLDGGSVGAL